MLEPHLMPWYQAISVRRCEEVGAVASSTQERQNQRRMPLTMRSRLPAVPLGFRQEEHILAIGGGEAGMAGDP